MIWQVSVSDTTNNVPALHTCIRQQIIQSRTSQLGPSMELPRCGLISEAHMYA